MFRLVALDVLMVIVALVLRIWDGGAGSLLVLALSVVLVVFVARRLWLFCCCNIQVFVALVVLSMSVARAVLNMHAV